MAHSFINWADFKDQLCQCFGGDITAGESTAETACEGINVPQSSPVVSIFTGDVSCVALSLVSGVYTPTGGVQENGSNVCCFEPDAAVTLSVQFSPAPAGCTCQGPTLSGEVLTFNGQTDDQATFSNDAGTWEAIWDCVAHDWLILHPAGIDCGIFLNFPFEADFTPFSTTSSFNYFDPFACGTDGVTFSIDTINNPTPYRNEGCLWTWQNDDAFLRVMYRPVSDTYCAVIDRSGAEWGGDDCPPADGGCTMENAAEVEIEVDGNGILNGTFILDYLGGDMSCIGTKVQVVLGNG
jgi:hypothetical protein